jgi:hypothetical protein
VSCSPGLLCVAVDDEGNIAAATPPPPANTAPPTLTGTAALGQALSEAPGTWTGDATSFAVQWETCDATGAACAAIGSATAATHTVTAADAGHTLRVQVTAANAGGAGAPAVSGPTAVVPALPVTPTPPVGTAPPTVTGAPIIGHRLHGSPGRWTGTAPVSLRYQWQRCRTAPTNIAGATGTTRLLAGADLGARIRLVVLATNAIGHTSAGSGRTATILSAAQIRTRLVIALALPRRGASLTRLLQHGLTLSLTAPVAGKLTLTWKLGRTVVATGTVTFAAAGTRKLALKLTRRGRALLAHARPPVALTPVAVLTPTGGGSITASRGLRPG